VKLTRRAALGGGLAALAVGLVVAFQPGRSRVPRRPLVVLDPRAFSVLAAVADRICPGGGGLPSAWELEVPEKVDAVLDRIDPAGAAEMRQILMLLESGLAGFAFDGRIRAFSAASPESQDRTLDRWRTSRWTLRRAAYKALSSTISAAYWSDPRTWPHIGYVGPPRLGP
jgi:hypothetical protein